MNKQLLTILKKRYGLLLVITCVAVLVFYLFSGFSDVSHWKDMNAYYNSEEFTEMLKDTPEENQHPKYKGLSIEEIQQAQTKENLMLFFQSENYNDHGMPSTDNDQTYYTGYFNENILFITALFSAAGFLLFFADLKTSFNEFLFSLGVSKRRIYFTKYGLIAVPLLGSLLLGKLLFVTVIVTGIPNEYVNISMPQLLTATFASWLTIVFYFSIAAFIGLISGNILLGPLTVFGFACSLEFFITSVTNAWFYFTHKEVEIAMTNNFFVYTITKNPISIPSIVLGISLSFILFIWGSFLFSTLTLENKGNYLLFAQLNIPVIIAMTIYVPIVLVFVRGFYTGEKTPSPIPLLIAISIATALIGSYLVYRKEIHERFNRHRQQKETMIGE